tara:strand:- start:118 stop:564 length:447 start_codon:yes stop_codon:yes gene_type:complete
LFKYNNNNKKNLTLFNNWKSRAHDLAVWLENKDNLRDVLNYIFAKNGEIDNLVILEGEHEDAFKFKMNDIIKFYNNLDYIVYVTEGCKVAIKAKIPKFGNDKKLVIFNFEIRGSKGKIGSINYWIDAPRFYNSIKKNLNFKLISNKNK